MHDSLQPNKEKFPQWDPAIAADMREETLRFFRDLLWERERPLTDLLNAQFTYATPRLAKHYGLEPKDEGFARYDLSSIPSRGGLLTQGGVLTIGGDEAAMVTRGLFALEELLLGKVGNPPPGLDTTPPPSMPGRSHRAISEERVNAPVRISSGSVDSPLRPARPSVHGHQADAVTSRPEFISRKWSSMRGDSNRQTRRSRLSIARKNPL